MFTKWYENIVGKGSIARNQAVVHFLSTTLRNELTTMTFKIIGIDGKSQAVKSSFPFRAGRDKKK